MTKSVAELFIEAADGIFCIVTEQDETNEALTELPPVLSHQIAKMDMQALSKLTQQRPTRGERKFTKSRYRQQRQGFYQSQEGFS